MKTKQRNVRFDERTSERLELLAQVTGKTASQVLRDLLMEGEVRVTTRVGDKAIQETLTQFHSDMNLNYLHTNAKLEQVETLISSLGERATNSQKVADLLYTVEAHLIQIKQGLSQYRQQTDKEASDLVNLQR